MRVIALRWHLSHAVQWSPFWIWESERLSHTSMVMRPIWSTYFPKAEPNPTWLTRASLESIDLTWQPGEWIMLKHTSGSSVWLCRKRSVQHFLLYESGERLFLYMPATVRGPERHLCPFLNLSEISPQKQPDFRKFPNRLWWIKSFRADPTPFSAWQCVTVILMINGGFYFPRDCECRETGDILLVTLWRITRSTPLSSKLLFSALARIVSSIMPKIIHSGIYVGHCTPKPKW